MLNPFKPSLTRRLHLRGNKTSIQTATVQMSSVASNVGLGGYIHNQGMSLDSNKNRVFNTKLVISYFNLALGQNTNHN